MKSGSVKDKQESDFDLEDFTEIMEKLQLENALNDKKREIKKLKKVPEGGDEDYKDNFLIKFLD